MFIIYGGTNLWWVVVFDFIPFYFLHTYLIRIFCVIAIVFCTRKMFQINQNVVFLVYRSLIKVARTMKHSHKRHVIDNYRQYCISPKIKYPTETPIFGICLVVASKHISAKEINEPTIEIIKNNLDQKLIEADKLLLGKKYEGVVLLLEEYQHMDDVQVLWRLGKAKFYVALECTTEERKNQLIESAHKSIIKALKIDSSISEVHKCYALINCVRDIFHLNLNYNSNRIAENVQKLKTIFADLITHLHKALELNPKDQTIFYLIGVHCYFLSINSKSWYFILWDFPTSSYEEALMYFKKAESIQPNFEIDNLFMLGKTYLKMNYKISAQYYFRLVAEYPAVALEDIRIKEKGKLFLKSMANRK